MIPLRCLFLVAVLASCGMAAEPEPAPASKITSFTGGWGKGSSAGRFREPSRLDGLTPDELKKTGDLAQPVAVTVLSTGRPVEGLLNIKDRIVDVRITNPNPYTIFFRGRQYRDNTTIKPIWNKLEDGAWKVAARDWCGTVVRDWEIAPGGTMDLLLTLHPELKEQQIVGLFYKAEKPSVQSECVLYEKR